MITIRKSEDRGHADHGWLNARHSFSFADYHDPRWMGYRSLRVINDDTVAGGGGFGMHPHRDMEIVTYILSGALQHRDSLGNTAVMKAGDVQRISAGTGVQHSEFNHSDSEPVHLLQIWIMPDARGVAPAYAEKSYAAVTDHALIASKSGRDGSIPIQQDADIHLYKLAKGDSAKHALANLRHAWVHVATGSVTVNGHPLKAGDAAAINGEGIELRGDEASQVLLFDLA